MKRTKYWPIFFVLGHSLALLIDHTLVGYWLSLIEIHFRLSIFFGLAILTYGGFLMTTLPNFYGLLVTAGVLIYFFFNRANRDT